MREILEVQMLRYSKIMLGNCCNIRSSLPSSIMSCHQWVIRSPDWPNHSFLTTKLFSPTLPLHSLLASPPVSHGRPNFRSCPGHTNIGRCRNFVHLVTGHTPGRINRNGTVFSDRNPLWWVQHCRKLSPCLQNRAHHCLTRMKRFLALCCSHTQCPSLD